MTYRTGRDRCRARIWRRRLRHQAVQRSRVDRPDPGFNAAGGADGSGGICQHRGLEIDSAGFRVRNDGRLIDLSTTEFRLLHELATHPDQVLSRKDLLRQVWGYEYLGDSRLVDMAMTRLRSKLGEDPHEPRYIETVRGVGYRFLSPEGSVTKS